MIVDVHVEEEDSKDPSEPQEDESMIIAVDVEADSKDPSEPPELQRRRCNGKQLDTVASRSKARARGLEYLTPRPLRLPLVMAAIISAMMNIWPPTLDDPSMLLRYSVVSKAS